MGNDQRQTEIGRPPGKAHPLPMFDFWIIFLEQLPEHEVVSAAYEAAEVLVVKEYGRRRFRTYVSFRSAKCRWLKLKKNVKT